VNYRVDALTRWRLAGCDYLAGEYDRAADQLALIIHQPDFDPALQPLADLQRVAALVLGGRAEEGQAVAQEITQREQSMRALDPVAATYASVLARVIAGIEPENAIASVFNKLIAMPGALLYREDEFFFAGELARRRGDLSLAAAHYQRCIDLARDDWPASWARVRLLELSRSVPAAPAGAKRQANSTEVVQ
jgi:tetratricopeptide (TPR) repeat protein